MGTNERSGAWFEDAWEFREETLYCSLFGDVGPGIYAYRTLYDAIPAGIN